MKILLLITIALLCLFEAVVVILVFSGDHFRVALFFAGLGLALFLGLFSLNTTRR